MDFKNFKLFGNSYQDLGEFWEPGFQYPHNIFLEMTLYFGLVGALMSLLLLNTTKESIGKRDMGTMIYIMFLSSALLSGDLTDNYPVFYFIK